MSFDGIFTRSMGQELRSLLIGGRVNKVDQPYKNECVLTIRNNRKNYPLLLSAHPQYARIQISQQNYKNPIQPPQFVMVMRKYLNRALLTAIEQVENDRVLHFHFQNRDELGDQNELLLVCELMGRHSNIILVNQADQKILELIRHVPKHLNSYRSLLPAADFIPAPKQDKINPFKSNTQELIQAVQQSNKQTLALKILDQIQGLGKDSAEELAWLADDQTSHLKWAWPAFVKKLEKNKGQAQLYQDRHKQYFTAIPYAIYRDLDCQSFPSLSQCLDVYYQEKAQRDRVHQLSSELFHLVESEIEKNKNKLAKQEKELKETKKAESYRIKGEVLTAYMHQVEQGMSEVSLANFYDNDHMITIHLNPQLSPAENAQKLFSRYQKLKNRKHYLSQQIKETKKEIAYLESVHTQLELADFSDIEDIREELIAGSYIKKNKKKRKKRQTKAKPHHYQTSSGVDILVGRNNRQNDQLSLKKASKNHYWFHTKNLAGSHLILQTEKPSEQDIIEAAEIAAYHSKAQQSSNVAVDYTEVKHVRKAKGAKPGLVIYDHQESIFVTPEKEKIKALKKEN